MADDYRLKTPRTFKWSTVAMAVVLLAALGGMGALVYFHGDRRGTGGLTGLTDLPERPAQSIADLLLRRPEPEPEPPPPPAEPEPEPAPAPPPPPPPPPPPVDPGPEPLTLDQAFPAAQAAAPLTKEQLADKINSERIGKVEFYHERKEATAFEPPEREWEEKQRDFWKENTQPFWMEPQTRASRPVNMERVIPVTKMIPALLVNQVNSELPGVVKAQIIQDICGGHGRKVLLPAGTQAWGQYQPLSKAGDERLAIIWTRFLTPSGINIHVANAEMADAMGRSGIAGELDTRFWDRFGLALFLTVGATVAATQIPVQNNQGAVLVDGVHGTVRDVANQILASQINIKPSVEIDRGSHLLITLRKDIWFPKPKPGEMDIEVLPLELAVNNGLFNQEEQGD